MIGFAFHFTFGQLTAGRYRWLCRSYVDFMVVVATYIFTVSFSPRVFVTTIFFCAELVC
jgi:hypothetical protein